MTLYYLIVGTIAILAMPFTSKVMASTSGGSVFGYNLGLTYEGTASHAEISYDTPSSKVVPENCVQNSERAGYLRCTAYLGPDGGTPSMGVYLEAPFKRQGLFYFDNGLTFSTVSYKGS